MLAELGRLPIVESGAQESEGSQVPYVVLANGTILNGLPTSDFERELYVRWRNQLPPAITEDCFRVALDAVLRYVYPHARPDLTVPHARLLRRGFHPQHSQSIHDFRSITEKERLRLLEVYQPVPGQSYLDVGAYIGFGTIRMAQTLGPQSPVVALEPDADALRLLEYNLECNGLDEVRVIPKAAWNRSGVVVDMVKGRRQANTLVHSVAGSGATSVVDAARTVPATSTTLDEVVAEIGGCVDRLNLTVNGAEVEAVEGLAETLGRCGSIRLTIAGWYSRDGSRVCDVVAPRLRESGCEVVVGRKGGVLAWKQ